MAKDTKFKFDDDVFVQQSIQEASDGVLKAEIEAEAAEKAELEAQLESYVETETAKEPDNRDSTIAEQLAELEALRIKATQLEAALAAKASPKVSDKNLVRQLRTRDPKNKKTCAACQTRVPLADIGYGHNDVCDVCLGK